MKTIFELKYSGYYSAEEFTDCVKFYEKIGYEDLMQFLETHDKNELLSVNHLIKHANDEFNVYLIDQYNWEYGFDDYEYTFKDFKKDFITEDYFSYELYEFLFNGISDYQLINILSDIGVKFGTVGYSPWCYYLALNNISSGFIDDLYNGYNIYDINQYDETGNILDSLSLVYAPNETDLIACINDYFNYNENDYIYLEDNDASTYIEHEKIKKINSYYEKKFVI